MSAPATTDASSMLAALWEYGPPLLILAAALALSDIARRRSAFYQTESGDLSPARVPTLDGLRGLLATGVAIHHYAMNHSYAVTPHSIAAVASLHRALGGFSVTLFFAITGYLFWGKAVAGKVSFWPHIRARVFRIAPLYWFAATLTFATALCLAGWPVASPGGESLHGLGRLFTLGLVPLRVEYFDDAGQSFVSEATFNGVSLFKINSVVWTLHYEWMFYLALPLLAFLRRPMVLGAFLMAFGALAALGVPFFRWPPYYPAFLVGMASVYVLQNERIRAALRRREMSVMAIAVLLAAPALSVQTSTSAGVLLLIVAFTSFVIIAAGNTLFGLLALPAARTLGAASFSIYLLHMIVMTALKPLLAHALGDAIPGRPSVAYWALSAAGVLATVCLSLATYRWIETPCVQYERRLRKRKARSIRVSARSEAPALT